MDVDQLSPLGSSDSPGAADTARATSAMQAMPGRGSLNGACLGLLTLPEQHLQCRQCLAGQPAWRKGTQSATRQACCSSQTAVQAAGVGAQVRWYVASRAGLCSRHACWADLDGTNLLDAATCQQVHDRPAGCGIVS